MTKTARKEDGKNVRSRTRFDRLAVVEGERCCWAEVSGSGWKHRDNCLQGQMSSQYVWVGSSECVYGGRTGTDSISGYALLDESLAKTEIGLIKSGRRAGQHS
jgi:hypothetical protein